MKFYVLYSWYVRSIFSGLSSGLARLKNSTVYARIINIAYEDGGSGNTRKMLMLSVGGGLVALLTLLQQVRSLAIESYFRTWNEYFSSSVFGLYVFRIILCSILGTS